MGNIGAWKAKKRKYKIADINLFRKNFYRKWSRTIRKLWTTGANNVQVFNHLNLAALYTWTSDIIFSLEYHPKSLYFCIILEISTNILFKFVCRLRNVSKVEYSHSFSDCYVTYTKYSPLTYTDIKVEFQNITKWFSSKLFSLPGVSTPEAHHLK